VLLLALLILSCSDGTGPGEAVLHDRIVFESASGIGVMAPDGSQQQTIPVGGDLEFVYSPQYHRMADRSRSPVVEEAKSIFTP
jgi:hypothetical protein